MSTERGIITSLCELINELLDVAIEEKYEDVATHERTYEALLDKIYALDDRNEAIRQRKEGKSK